MNARGRRAYSLLAVAVSCLALGCGGSSTPTTPSTPPNPMQFDVASFRRAASITAETQTAVRASTHAGMWEGDVKAIVSSTFTALGSGPPAFDHIVASGPNAVNLHYTPSGDGRRLANGDLLLVDIGATYGQHCADVTRTFPVSGQFTERQRELYQVVVDVRRTIVSQARTGVDSLLTMHDLAVSLFRASPLRAKDMSGNEQTMDRFFAPFQMLGHYVGRQVHGEDTGWSVSAPLAADQVLAIEPAVYIASEGIGIRVEDTFLVTAQGLECLSCGAPVEALSMAPRGGHSLFAMLFLMPGTASPR